MSNHLLFRHKRGLITAAVLCGALALSACGGSSNDSPQPAPPVGGTPTPAPPVSVVDSFLAFVKSLVGTQPDNTEPVVITGITETKPENTEPEPVN